MAVAVITMAVAATVVDTHLTVADMAMAAGTHTMAEDAALAVVDTASVVEVDTALAAAPMEAEAGTAAAMVAAIGNLDSQIEILAADGIRCRPLGFREPRSIAMEVRYPVPHPMTGILGGEVPTTSIYFWSVTLKYGWQSAAGSLLTVLLKSLLWMVYSRGGFLILLGSPSMCALPSLFVPI